MNFVTVSDFDKLPYSLPAKDIGSTDFESFMTIAEEDKLRCLLGHVFYDELIAEGLYLPPQKWTDFIDGAYYTYASVTYKWVGLNKMLVPYLYVVRTKATLDSHTGTGINKPTVENAERISFRQRAADAWNFYADAYGVNKNQKNSLYGFIQANLVDYPNYRYPECDSPCYPKHMNAYGL